MKPLRKSTVLITGALGSIGRACVRAFLDAGASVVATDIASGGFQKNARCRFLRADLQDEKAIRELVAFTVRTFGSLDVLLNNAALIPPLLPVHKTTAADFDRLVAVNLRAVFLCCKYAYPHLRRSKGSILNMSSMAGVHGEQSHAIYSATKGAVNALTQAMAIDYGADRIRCNAICPSSVLTPAVDRLIRKSRDPKKVVEYRKRVNHLGYTARPEEIASVAVFLASPAASFMTGAVVPVSGGSECGYGLKK